MSSSRWKFKKHFRGTPYGREWLEREMMLLSAVKSHPINQCKVSDNLSKYHMRQAGTEDDIREVQGVFFLPSQMSWQETDFSQSQEKSAKKYVSVDSSTLQLLNSDRAVAAGTLKALSPIPLELKAQHLIILITRITELGWRWGSTGKARLQCGTSTLNLNS